MAKPLSSPTNFFTGGLGIGGGSMTFSPTAMSSMRSFAPTPTPPPPPAQVAPPPPPTLEALNNPNRFSGLNIGFGNLFGSLRTMHGQGNLANKPQPAGTIAAPPPQPPTVVDAGIASGATVDASMSAGVGDTYDPLDFNKDGGVSVLDMVAGRAQGASPEELEAIMNYGLGKDEGGDAPDPLASQTFEPDMATVNQTVPVPSLTSASNVGSIAPTGNVNWKAIPGGFQPLPAMSGQRKRLYQLSQFHGGINQKSSPRDIADNECQEATNVTFSKIGRIMPVGDIKGTNNSITVGDNDDVTGADGGAPGFGLFQFNAVVDQDGASGQETITLTADGNHVDAYSAGGGNDSAWMTLGSTDNHDVAQVYYAFQNGVFAGDASFQNTPRAKIWVYREDAGSNTVSGWVEGKFMIDSPTYDSDADDDMAAGTVKCTHNGGTASVNGTLIADCAPTGTGTWNGTYFFYISWLFDESLETGLTSFGTDDGADAASNGIAFSNNKLSFNLSLVHANAKALGGDKRIYGARIYYKKSGDVDRYRLVELHLRDGVKSSTSSSYIPWNESSDVYNLSSDIVFEDAPDIYTYESDKDGVIAEEFYGESKDEIASTTAGPVGHDIKFGTATVGQNGHVYLGNISFNGSERPDAMMYSLKNSGSAFPMFNLVDSPSSDGSKIIKLESFQDTVLQFKENSLYTFNISNPQAPYAEAVFKDCGIYNPCQVFKTSFGVIFANDNGCFIYDGRSVTSLTNGKFARTDWALTSGSGIGVDGAAVPCVGYDPRSQNIIVLKNIGDNSTDTGAWIFNMPTQSWTEGLDMITNGNENRHTNFIITSDGYLSIKRDDSQSIFDYTQGNNAQKFIFQTKDMDFGLPSQTKKLFKVYITYKGNASNLTATWRYNGETTDRGFTATNWADNSDIDDFEVATLVPDSLAESKGWKSMSIYITSASNTVATDFEINDIAILYRARPIK